MDPLRKRFSGDTRAAQHHAGLALKLLAQVKQQMALGGLRQFARQVVLASGVVLFAASRFGQDEIRVHAPATAGGSGGFGQQENRVNHTVIICAGEFTGTLDTAPGPDLGVYYWEEGDAALTWLPVTGNASNGVAAVAGSGDVCGTMSNTAPQPNADAFRWSRARGLEVLAPGPDGITRANAISDDGEVVAGQYTLISSPFPTYACIWEKGKGMTTLPLAPGDLRSSPVGVGAGRRVVGTSGTDPLNLPMTGNLWLWSPTDGLRVLRTMTSDNGPILTPRISADGSAVAWLESDNMTTAGAIYYWTERTGTQLVAAGTMYDAVTCLSPSGSTVYLARFEDPDALGPPVHYRWTAAGGLQREDTPARTDPSNYSTFAVVLPADLPADLQPAPAGLEVQAGYSTDYPYGGPLTYWRDGAQPLYLPGGPSAREFAVAIRTTITPPHGAERTPP